YLTLVKGPQNDLDAADKALTAAQDAANNKIGVCDTSSQTGNADQCNANVQVAQNNYDVAHKDKFNHDVIGFSGVGIGVALLATGVILLVTGDDPNRYNHAPSEDLGRRDHGPRWAVLPGPGQAGFAFGASF